MKNYIKGLEMILLVCFFLVGCLAIGGQTVNPETISKLETSMKTVQKKIDDSQQQIDSNSGNISTFKTDISNIINTQITLQTQITNLNTVNNNHNESIKSLLWSIAGIWIAINLAKFIQICVAAKVMPGHTFKNIWTMPFGKGKE